VIGEAASTISESDEAKNTASVTLMATPLPP
jgi:hypothetical protein